MLKCWPLWWWSDGWDVWTNGAELINVSKEQHTLGRKRVAPPSQFGGVSEVGLEAWEPAGRGLVGDLEDRRAEDEDEEGGRSYREATLAPLSARGGPESWAENSGCWGPAAASGQTSVSESSVNVGRYQNAFQGPWRFNEKLCILQNLLFTDEMTIWKLKSLISGLGTPWSPLIISLWRRPCFTLHYAAPELLNQRLWWVLRPLELGVLACESVSATPGPTRQLSVLCISLFAVLFGSISNCFKGHASSRLIQWGGPATWAHTRHPPSHTPVRPPGFSQIHEKMANRFLFFCTNGKSPPKTVSLS